MVSFAYIAHDPVVSVVAIVSRGCFSQLPPNALSLIIEHESTREDDDSMSEKFLSITPKRSKRKHRSNIKIDFLTRKKQSFNYIFFLINKQ